MRLGTCIALELAVATAVTGGAWYGVTAVAALREPAARVAPAPERPAQRVVVSIDQIVSLDPPAAAAPELVTVFGAPDHELLAPIAATPLVRAKLNRGGSSLSLRLDFASGARAAFKPLQVHPQSDPRREIAAFRIDRLLGLGHVPPAKAAGFLLEDVVAAVDPAARRHAAQRLADEATPRRGVLYGAVSWWIPEIKALRIGGQLIDEPSGEAAWTAYLQAGAARPVSLTPLLAQIAAAIVFDVVIDNSDRWSGNNTQGSPDGRTFYFMDNTLSFSQFTLGHAANLARLHRIQVFPRALIERLRELRVESVTAALSGDAELLGPLLSSAEIAAVMARRDHVVRYVERLVAERGVDKVLALP